MMADTPDTPAPLSQFALLGVAVFNKAVGRIGYDGLNRVRLARAEPFETIGLYQLCPIKLVADKAPGFCPRSPKPRKR
jgi:hypothetical protein